MALAVVVLFPTMLFMWMASRDPTLHADTVAKVACVAYQLVWWAAYIVAFWYVLEEERDPKEEARS